MSVESALNPDFRGLGRSIVISIVIPAILVQVLIRQNVPLISALAISAIFPVGATLRAWARKQFDVIAALGVFFILVGIVTSYASADPHYALIAGSLGSALFGSVCLASLLAPRPLIFVIARSSAGGNAKTQSEFDRLWETQAGYRSSMRLITLVWGLGLLGAALLRVLLIELVDPRLGAIVSPLLDGTALVGLILWTIFYVRNVRRRADLT